MSGGRVSDKNSQFVRIATFVDSINAQMAQQILTDHGIASTAPGAMHRGVEGGFVAGFIQIPLSVPKDKVDEALELLRAFGVIESGGASNTELSSSATTGPSSSVAAPTREPPASSSESPRSLRVAFFFGTFFGFGSGFFYARANKLGVLSLIFDLFSFTYLIAVPESGFSFLIFRVVTGLGAAWAAKRFNRGELSFDARLLLGAIAVAVTTLTVPTVIVCAIEDWPVRTLSARNFKEARRLFVACNASQGSGAATANPFALQWNNPFIMLNGMQGEGRVETSACVEEQVWIRANFSEFFVQSLDDVDALEQCLRDIRGLGALRPYRTDACKRAKSLRKSRAEADPTAMSW